MATSLRYHLVYFLSYICWMYDSDIKDNVLTYYEKIIAFHNASFVLDYGDSTGNSYTISTFVERYL